MSADNGIYILCLKDQFRVIHTQGIDNLYWDDEKLIQTNNPQPKQVVDYYKDAFIFSTETAATAFASSMLRALTICEHGVSTIELKQHTWNDLVKLSIDHLEFDAAIITLIDKIFNIAWNSTYKWEPTNYKVAYREVKKFMVENKPICSCCAGTGSLVVDVLKSLSFSSCICGGKGTQEAELEGLRQAYFNETQKHLPVKRNYYTEKMFNK